MGFWPDQWTRVVGPEASGIEHQQAARHCLSAQRAAAPAGSTGGPCRQPSFMQRQLRRACCARAPVAAWDERQQPRHTFEAHTALPALPLAATALSTGAAADGCGAASVAAAARLAWVGGIHRAATAGDARAERCCRGKGTVAARSASAARADSVKGAGAGLW